MEGCGISLDIAFGGPCNHFRENFKKEKSEKLKRN